MKERKEIMTPEEIEKIREIVKPRFEAVQNGTAKLYDVDEVFDEIESELFT